MNESESLRGHLLVAAPNLVDPNFRRTVVLIAEHTADGAMGLVINRPAPAAVADAVPQLADLAGDDAKVFVGGPVERDNVFVLADFEEAEETGAIVLLDIGTVSDDAEPEHDLTGRAARHARVFAGYAGWGPGQLEGELAEEAWIVDQPEEGDIFSDAPEKLWSQVLRRKGGQYGVLALMPDDPSVN